MAIETGGENVPDEVREHPEGWFGGFVGDGDEHKYGCPHDE